MKHRLTAALAAAAFASVVATAQAVLPPEEAAKAEIMRAAEALRGQLVEWRRDFHMHPELSNREERTARVIAERLRTMGFDDVKSGVAEHGIVALLKGAKPGPVVAVRADMDALPVEETLDVPYKSKNPGVKHACGHDVHLSVALGVAQILSGRRDLINGTIKFIFSLPRKDRPRAKRAEQI